MIKNILFQIAILSLSTFSVFGQGGFKDGVYTGESRARYIQEPYVGVVTVKIVDGYFDDIDFKIMDTLKNEAFNSGYEKYFEGNDLYVKQCMNELNAIPIYESKLLKCQNIERVDVISGATWSYNIFKAALIEAIKNAR